MTLLELQQKYVDEVLRCIDVPWDHVEVHFEYVWWKGNRMVSYTSNSYRDGIRSDLDLSFDAVDLMEQMRDAKPEGQAEHWTGMDFRLDATGKYTFDYTYGMPPMTARTLAAQPRRAANRSAPSVRTPDARDGHAGVEAAVSDTWREIESLLRARGAMELLALNPPADPGEVEALERHLGRAVPAALKELLAIHDGQSESAACGLFFGLHFLSVEGIRAHWDNVKSLADDDDLNERFASSMSARPPGFIKPLYVNTGWIPFTHDGGNNHTALDLDPDAGGRAGQVITFGPDENEKKLLGTLTGGLPRAVPRPPEDRRVDDGPGLLGVRGGGAPEELSRVGRAPRDPRNMTELHIAEIPYESGAIHYRYSRYLAPDGTRWIRHGLFRAYHENGALASEGHFEDGAEHGLWRDFHPNGRPAEYEHGQEVGTWRYWDEDGRESHE